MAALPPCDERHAFSPPRAAMPETIGITDEEATMEIRVLVAVFLVLSVAVGVAIRERRS